MRIELMIVIGLFLIVIVFAIVFPSMGNWLIVKDSLEKVDAIIIISGDQGERVRYGAKLFTDNYATHLIISGCPGTKNLSAALNMKDQAISLGVPPENIILEILKDHSSGTGIQANNIEKIMLKNGFKSAILVTSNFHTRRSRLIFQRVFKKNNMKLLMAYPERNVFDAEGWWKTKDNRRIVISELIKLVWYWFTFSSTNN